ncbi:hypothetical protein [Actinokineospora fastidiosa]|uniref:hypothetical protein n=1 Tax=Actinokineospora fastidiosa TaxID=1816 RepID=UPI0016714481|nr:hypothetical protein [Actinokineospora fastidiosa]
MTNHTPSEPAPEKSVTNENLPKGEVVSNELSGDVHGISLQAKDIAGGIHFNVNDLTLASTRGSGAFVRTLKLLRGWIFVTAATFCACALFANLMDRWLARGLLFVHLLIDGVVVAISAVLFLVGFAHSRRSGLDFYSYTRKVVGWIAPKTFKATSMATLLTFVVTLAVLLVILSNSSPRADATGAYGYNGVLLFFFVLLIFSVCALVAKRGESSR